MTFVISLVFAIALGLVIYLLWHARQRLAIMQGDLATLARELEQTGEEHKALFSQISGSRILIEINNPVELARENSPWSARVAGMAPRMLNRRVYDTVARELKAELAERGVDAHLQIFHPSDS